MLKHSYCRRESKLVICKIKLFTTRIFLTEVFKVVGAAAKVSLATVYQKHSSLRTRKRMYRG